MEKIIEVKNLKKSYGNVKAVNGVEFYVEPGKLFAFLGPNGAGKSTTIDMICTLLKPDDGEIIIDGHRVAESDDKIRELIGVVFQDSVLDPLLTVRENLKTRAKFYPAAKTRLREMVENAVKAADVIEFIDRPYGKLSGGQRRRADIARALVNTPKILFLDEPTTGLDPQTRTSVWNTIANLQRESGMTVFLTTHYMEEAAAADYITIIDDGEIVAKGTPYQLKNTYSADTLRIRTLNPEALDKLLHDMQIGFNQSNGVYMIKLTDTKNAIPIIKATEQYIESFEVIHGTMDEVFINITGRDIR